MYVDNVGTSNNKNLSGRSRDVIMADSSVVEHVSSNTLSGEVDGVSMGAETGGFFLMLKLILSLLLT